MSVIVNYSHLLQTIAITINFLNIHYSSANNDYNYKSWYSNAENYNSINRDSFTGKLFKQKIAFAEIKWFEFSYTDTFESAFEARVVRKKNKTIDELSVVAELFEERIKQKARRSLKDSFEKLKRCS